MLFFVLPKENILIDDSESVPELTREQVDALVKRTKNGDSRAFGLLYDYHADRIFRYIYYKTSHTFDAEDLTAEVFLRAFEKIATYEIKEHPFSAWLYRIAHNAVVDYYRVKGKSPVSAADEEDLPVSEQHNPEFVLLSNLDSRDLGQAMQKLTDEQREVIHLRFIEGLPARQVAQIMGKPESAVRALQHRGLKALSRVIGHR